MRLEYEGSSTVRGRRCAGELCVQSNLEDNHILGGQFEGKVLRCQSLFHQARELEQNTVINRCVCVYVCVCAGDVSLCAGSPLSRHNVGLHVL